ncbi:MAG: FAD-binding dehydrogenase [Alcaligenaceae bacterium]|nr:MAG: FAD-binding dehydrogenase [Alcaligenaceae bacterium]
MGHCDVVVVGAGNAGMCAALSAAEHGARVLVLERAPFDQRGGNSRYTAGAFRVVYDGAEDLRKLMPDLADQQVSETDFGSYTRASFFEDMARVTQNRADPDLVEVLVDRSYDTLSWMYTKGIRFSPMYGRQAFKQDGRFRFWGGLTVEAWGGGPGLIEQFDKAIDRTDEISIQYDSRATELILEGNRIVGVTVQTSEGERNISCDAVILACGGFEANPAWRAKYLGASWDLAKVRGTRFNTGDGHRMGMSVGGEPAGNWSGCHAVSWDANAPEFGTLKVGDGFQKHSYPFGIMVNNRGERFVDEGEDFRNYTYAKYGRAVLAQPNQVAWQVFDSSVSNLLRDEYRIREVTRVRANSLKELGERMEGMNVDAFVATVEEFNSAVDRTVPFDPTVKDGRSTVGLAIDKSNWANAVESPPFEAYSVTCGITFTFGGLRIDTNAAVLNSEGNPVPGLFAAGEIVGGIFYHNYPGGTGLTSGSVFGRMAGASAAETVRS